MHKCLVALTLVGCTSGIPALAAPPTWRNSIGMPFVLVPAGDFWMGGADSPATLARRFPLLEAERFTLLADESPVHRVQISRAFYMGQHEVTVGQFRRFIAASGYQPESERDGTGGYGYAPRMTRPAPGAVTRSRAATHATPGATPALRRATTTLLSTSPGTTPRPWPPGSAAPKATATACPRKPNGNTPAAPAPARSTRTLYPHGDDPQGLLRSANIFDQDSAAHWPKWQQHALKGHDGYAFTAPVGSFAPNAFGLHDMLGNAWEWVADWHGDDTYANNATQTPAPDPQGPATGDVRVRRGGSWHTWAFYARCGYRNWNSPETRYTLVGMRLVREVEP